MTDSDAFPEDDTIEDDIGYSEDILEIDEEADSAFFYNSPHFREQALATAMDFVKINGKNMGYGPQDVLSIAELFENYLRNGAAKTPD